MSASAGGDQPADGPRHGEMTVTVARLANVMDQGNGAVPALETVLHAIPAAVVVVDREHKFVHANAAGEAMFRAGSAYLRGRPLADFLAEDSPAFSLVRQARDRNALVSEYELTLESARIGRHFLTAHAVPLDDGSGAVVLSLLERGITEIVDRQLTHRGAARSVSSMAAMLAHEIRNPLSGIRGAAQLLEQSAADGDKPLAELIRSEVDRISELISRMEVFSETAKIERKAVNIHQVLDRVQRLAETGFGQSVRFRCHFDPSLPPVNGDHDHLVQVFLNLIKNAVEACPEVGGEITLKTAYQRGVRFTLPGSKVRVELPLLVSITDNGVGIPADLRDHLFDPFVTSKRNGSGLGLALVAKLIGEHGGVIECESVPGRTEFRIMLPFHSMAGHGGEGRDEIRAKTGEGSLS